MPSQPPVNRRPQAWAAGNKRPADRQSRRALRTSSKAWRAIRDQVLLRDGYTCQACGRVVHGSDAHVDHIDGDDSNNPPDGSNWQVLCARDHALKTVAERSSGPATAHPEWLPEPACRVVLVSGPPGSGKTTYAHQHAGPADVVIDLDDCFELVCGVHGHRADSQYLSVALRVRNKMLAQLASKTTGTAYVIVSAPTDLEVDWWQQKLKAESVRLMVPQSVCEQRLGDGRKHLARGWYLRATQRWTPTGARSR